MISELLGLARTYDPHKTRRFQLTVVLSIVVQAAGTLALVPLIVAWANRDTTAALISLGILVALVMANWAIDRIVQERALEIGFTLLDSIQHRLAQILTTVPSSWLTDERRSRATHVLSGIGPELVASIGYVLTPAITGFALPVVLAVGLVALAVVYGFSPLIGVAGLVAYLGVVGAWFGTIRISEQADAASQRANSAVTDRLIEFAGQQRTLRSSGQATSMQSAVARAVRRQSSATLKLIGFQIPGQLLFGITMQLALIALATTTVWQWYSGAITAPLAVALIVMSVRFLEPLAMLADLSEGVNYSRTLIREINELLSVEQSDKKQVTVGQTSPEVTLTDVTFSYPHDEQFSQPRVLEEFSIRLEPGTTTALIGPSGSGKTTVLSLIAGLEKPQSGSVLIDGQPAQAGMASVVFQFPYLFDASIRDNIAVDSSGQTETIARAVELARVTDVASGLPDGLDTRVGEGGKNLSGGERQRVSIARALANPSRLLLIDEATSALDHENEAAVRQALATPGYTRLIIAHRPAAVAGVDRVVVLDRGKIVADGSPDEVERVNEYYREFLRDGAQALQWRIG